MSLFPVFSRPWLLLLLVLVPALLWLWRRRSGAGLRFSDALGLRGLPPGRGRRAVRAGAGLRALALVLLILALAGPRWPDHGTRIASHGIAIAMVVDVSGSMANRDYVWEGQPISRLEAVKKAFRLMVEGGTGPGGQQLQGRPNDLIALVVFAVRPDTACPLTLNHDVLLRILGSQEPRTLTTEATTNSGDAIAWAVGGLQRTKAKRKVVVLLSDGEHNVPPPALKPRQAAQLAGNLGMPIYAIHAGSETAEEEGGAKPQAGADEAAREPAIRAKKSLEEVARISGGKYFQASDSAALLDVCAHIDRLERDEIPSFQYRRYYDGFVWFALASLLGWLSVHLLETTIWRRVP